jgi:HK97 family phage portal protein
MFKNFSAKIKNFIGSDPFSSISMFAFSNYKKNHSPTDFLNAYGISLYTNRALSKRAEKVGQVQFVLKQGDKVIENHEILDLLAKPNKAFTGQEFWALYQKYMDIFGEAYIVTDSESRMGGKKKINSLILLRSDMVTPYFDETTGEITKIVHRTTKGEKTYEADQVIYAHNPNPENPLRGESLLQSGIRQIETSTQIDEYHSKILENGGRVEGVFTFETPNLTKTQLTELKDSYQAQYGDASKSGLPLFLAGGAKFNPVGLNPAELAYLETKNVTLNDIIILTGVPRAILGATSGETFSNADASIKIFLKETIKPLMDSLVTNLNENFVGEELELSYIDPTPEDKEEKRKDIETADKVHALTTNEKREALGMTPIKGGDTILVPMNLMPMGENAPVPAEKPAEKKKGCGCGVEIKSDIAHPLKDLSVRQLYHSLCLKRLDRRQNLMEGVIQGYFDEQKDRIVEKLSAQKHFRTKDLLTEIFYTTLEVKLAKETVLPILNQLMIEAAEESKQIAGSDWDFENTPEIQGWLDKKTSIFAEQITNTTFKELQKQFQDSLNMGESRLELIKRIEDTYGSINKARAGTIARTEVHGVTQYGTFQGYKQASMPIKIWVWAPGVKGGVRDNHQGMDGEEKPIGVAFSNGLMFPGGSGPAEEVINCECFH